MPHDPRLILAREYIACGENVEIDYRVTDLVLASEIINKLGVDESADLREAYLVADLIAKHRENGLAWLKRYGESRVTPLPPSSPC